MRSTEDGLIGDETNRINAKHSSTFACASYNDDTLNTFVATLFERECFGRKLVYFAVNEFWADRRYFVKYLYADHKTVVA